MCVLLWLLDLLLGGAANIYSGFFHHTWEAAPDGRGYLVHLLWPLARIFLLPWLTPLLGATRMWRSGSRVIILLDDLNRSDRPNHWAVNY